MRFMLIGLRLPGPSPPPAPFQVCGAPLDKNPREVFKEQKMLALVRFPTARSSGSGHEKNCRSARARSRVGAYRRRNGSRSPTLEGSKTREKDSGSAAGL
jgi:hypothetical protein